MSKKMVIYLRSKVLLIADEDAEVNEIVEKMDCDFKLNSSKAKLVDASIESCEIID